MFSHFYKFEIGYWLRRPMVYIFLFVNFLLIFSASLSDKLTIGGSVGNILRNAPFIIANWYAVMSVVVGLIMTAAFMQGAALRDFDNNSYQIIFSSPISRKGYYFGRFLGAATVAAIPFLGIFLGMVLGSVVAPALGWIDAERFGPTLYGAHLHAFLTFGLPMILGMGGIIFAVAALTRSTMKAFIAALTLFMGYLTASSLMSDVNNENIAILTDAFGLGVLNLTTKYWSPSDKNTLIITLFDAKMGLNRLLWTGLGVLILVGSYLRFSFAEKTKKTKKAAENKTENAVAIPVFAPLPTFAASSTSSWSQVWDIAKNNFFAIFKDTTFRLLAGLSIVNTILSFVANTESYGLTSYPVTYKVIDDIEGTMTLFLIPIIMFYAGQLVWRERDAHFDQIFDALPYPTWANYIGRFLAMFGIIFVLQCIALMIGVGKQTSQGFYDYDLGQYGFQMFFEMAYRTFGMTALAMLVHTLVNNKYVGFFVFLLVQIGKEFLWSPLDISSKLVRINSRPAITFSDMNRYGADLGSHLWFSAYWSLFAAILAIITIAFWVRKRDDNWAARWRLAKAELSGNLRLPLLLVGGLWVLCGSWIYYNTNVLNHYYTVKQTEKMQVAYENTYKRYENVATPTTIDVDFKVDLFPAERNANVSGKIKVVNKTTQPIDSLFFSLDEMLAPEKLKLDIPNGAIALRDTVLGFTIVKLQRPLQPNDTLTYAYSMKTDTKGFENGEANKKICENGTFFNHRSISPMVGYDAGMEMADKNERKKYGLPAKNNLMPALQDSCTSACMHTYLDKHSNWVTMRTTISTSDDQIAIAPGSLRKEWKEGNRNYYTYELDHASMYFGSFMSARYEVKKEQWNGISLEVYYDAKHPYNVDRIFNSMKKSLTYYTQNFGPYYHKQCRVIEFPRYETFAQAFPGTMPYSESIGFIDKYDEKTDIDKVFYIVAHEIGHQYWAHQVIGAEMQGATVLSETFAQYSALMVMEKEYGRDAMQKFLRYELDYFLNSRSEEALKENPLGKVEASQGYVHYRKGSCVMYYLKEMIGEAKVNEALRELITNYAYKEPPYPTSHTAIDAFRNRTPDSLRYIINDMFETITLFDNRVLEATHKTVADGKFETTIKVESKKIRADSLGKESNIAINDWIDIAVFDEPEKGKKIGKPLASRRVKITQNQNSFTFTTDKKPYEAGIDPYHYLIDRVIDDNRKTVE